MKLPADCSSMDDVRTEIDSVDKELIDLLSKRWQYVDRMWALKRQHEARASVPWRNTQVIAKVRAHARSRGVPEEMAEALWRQIIGWGIQYQDEKLQN